MKKYNLSLDIKQVVCLINLSLERRDLDSWIKDFIIDPEVQGFILSQDIYAIPFMQSLLKAGKFQYFNDFAQHNEFKPYIKREIQECTKQRKLTAFLAELDKKTNSFNTYVDLWQRSHGARYNYGYLQGVKGVGQTIAAVIVELSISDRELIDCFLEQVPAEMGKKAPLGKAWINLFDNYPEFILSNPEIYVHSPQKPALCTQFLHWTDNLFHGMLQQENWSRLTQEPDFMMSLVPQMVHTHKQAFFTSGLSYAKYCQRWEYLLNSGFFDSYYSQNASAFASHIQDIVAGIGALHRYDINYEKEKDIFENFVMSAIDYISKKGNADLKDNIFRLLPEIRIFEEGFKENLELHLHLSHSLAEKHIIKPKSKI